jgi:hypothetical protein
MVKRFTLICIDGFISEEKLKLFLLGKGNIILMN